MSLNIGQQAVEACKRLANQPDWLTIRAALLEQSRVMMNRALDCPHDAAADSKGYARAIRDIYVALESATSGEAIQRVVKPGPLTKGGSNAA